MTTPWIDLLRIPNVSLQL